MGVAIRTGTPNDVRELVRMHAQCSPTSVERRFLAPMPVLDTRLAAQLLCPADGFSLVGERDHDMVAIATVAPYDVETTTAEVGQLVIDRCQRQGIGTALLVAATRHAARFGFGELVLTTHPGNRAVLPTVNAAGLRARVSMLDGFIHVIIALSPSRHPLPGSGGRRAAIPSRLHSTRASANN